MDIDIRELGLETSELSQLVGAMPNHLCRFIWLESFPSLLHWACRPASACAGAALIAGKVKSHKAGVEYAKDAIAMVVFTIGLRRFVLLPVNYLSAHYEIEVFLNRYRGAMARARFKSPCMTSVMHWPTLSQLKNWCSMRHWDEIRVRESIAFKCACECSCPVAYLA